MVVSPCTVKLSGTVMEEDRVSATGPSGAGMVRGRSVELYTTVVVGLF